MSQTRQHRERTRLAVFTLRSPSKADRSRIEAALKSVLFAIIILIDSRTRMNGIFFQDGNYSHDILGW